MKWLADENFDNDVIRGLRRRYPAFDIVRAQDIPQIAGKGDVVVLEHASDSGRIVVTHDTSTMAPALREQFRLAGKCAPVVLVPEHLPIGLVIEQLLIFDQCTTDADWIAGVHYLPI